jgi:uncharacterized protein YkwD
MNKFLMKNNFMKNKLIKALISLIGLLMLSGLQYAQAGCTDSLLSLANQNRQTALNFSDQLTQVAQRHAQNMALRSSLDSSLPSEEIRATGYGKAHLGLIVAAGQRSPTDVICYWMSSQSRTYLTNEHFTDVGIGCVYEPSNIYRHYWVMIFGGKQASMLPQAGYTEIRQEITTQGQQSGPLMPADAKKSLLSLTNQNRHTALVFSEALNQIAQKMVQNPHARLGGCLPSDEIRTMGYAKPRLGLIVAAGYGSPAEVIRFWMSSRRTYLTDERFTDVGIGYVYDLTSTDHHYWVMIFGGGQQSQAGYTEIRRKITNQGQQSGPLIPADAKKSVLSFTNQKRRTALVFSEALNQVAQNMVQNPQSRFEGRLPSNEIKAMGYNKPRLGLIVAAGYSSPAEVIRFWMGSQSRTLTNERFTDVGIGYVYEQTSKSHYWVMILGGGY